MANIQLGTTLGAATGTGREYKPFSLTGDTALYKELAPSGRSDLLSVKRTLPKATKTYPGVERGEIKLTRFITVDDVEYPCIFTLTSAVPVPVASAARTAGATDVALIAGKSLWSDLVGDQSIPQA